MSFLDPKAEEDKSHEKNCVINGGKLRELGLTFPGSVCGCVCVCVGVCGCVWVGVCVCVSVCGWVC